MAVLSVDGQRLTGLGAAEYEGAIRAELVGSTGEVIPIKVIESPIIGRATKYSLWAVGGMFILLGAAVVTRRPDLASARVFGLFAAANALGLAVSPASGGPGTQWALIVQILALAGVGITFLPFSVALLSDSRSSRLGIAVRVFAGIGVLILMGYAVSVAVTPALYEQVRPALFLYVSVSVLGALGFLVVVSTRGSAPATRQQARIALFGVGLGAGPFVALTLVPEALGQDSLMPDYVTILAAGLIPAAFAYAILQHQMLGIRRLVHRGMVYGIVSFGLFSLVATGVTVAVSVLGDISAQTGSIAAVSAVLAAGVVLPRAASGRALVGGQARLC
jgi:hypothetical protein